MPPAMPVVSDTTLRRTQSFLVHRRWQQGRSGFIPSDAVVNEWEAQAFISASAAVVHAARSKAVEGRVYRCLVRFKFEHSGFSCIAKNRQLRFVRAAGFCSREHCLDFDVKASRRRGFGSGTARTAGQDEGSGGEHEVPQSAAIANATCGGDGGTGHSTSTPIRW